MSLWLTLFFSVQAHALPKCGKGFSTLATPAVHHVTHLMRWPAVQRHFTGYGMPPRRHPAVGPPTGRNHSLPFGKFRVGDNAFVYGDLPQTCKRLEEGAHIFYGRETESRAEAEALVQRYFTAGVTRGPGHYDVDAHQGTDARTSGFTNGSEDYRVAERFALGSGSGSGVAFVYDVTGSEVLNIAPFRDYIADPTAVSHEREVLIKGGLQPRKVQAAVVYERGKPVAFYTNPNYAEPE